MKKVMFAMLLISALLVLGTIANDDHMLEDVNKG